MSKLIDLTGHQFGRWRVLVRHSKGDRYGATRWRCRCRCGAVRVVLGNNLRRGWSTSCGCFHREKVTKHGMYQTRAYRAWAAMKQRCLNPNNVGFSNYGGRDVPITVCEEYRDFVNWYADLGDPPPGLWLERVDNSLGYMPSNCTWATPTEQARNRRPPKRKPRRAKLDAILAYSTALARAASSKAGVTL